VTVRSLALDLYTVGSHKAAERLYRGLLALRFQQPGTLIHLTRVLLMQDRLPEARKAVSEAWKRMRNREGRLETPPYVPSRIIFFRMFFAMLARANYSRLVAVLKQELLGNSSRESWTIGSLPAIVETDDNGMYVLKFRGGQLGHGLRHSHGRRTDACALDVTHTRTWHNQVRRRMPKNGKEMTPNLHRRQFRRQWNNLKR